jgi:hypothetical protein
MAKPINGPDAAGPRQDTASGAISNSSGLAEQSGALPGDFVIRADVQSCLLDAMTDSFPITRDQIQHDTKPSDRPIGADAQGWGICLQVYAGAIRSRRAAYGAYTHRPIYTTETRAKGFSDIVNYLVGKLVAQLLGKSE